jgi:hypothetical protein
MSGAATSSTSSGAERPSQSQSRWIGRSCRGGGLASTARRP